MTPAFWDASALVPLCVQQQQSPNVRELLQKYEVVVWWATSVEIHGAFERLLRMEQLTKTEHLLATTRLAKLRRGWREVQPTIALRSHAEALLLSHPLKAADALQLSAAWTWCSGDAGSYTFISGDVQLIEAARRVGFHAVMA